MGTCRLTWRFTIPCHASSSMARPAARPTPAGIMYALPKSSKMDANPTSGTRSASTLMRTTMT